MGLRGNGNFYIDQTDGQIFLVSNNGKTNINQVCPSPCSLTITAQLENSQPAELTLQVENDFYLDKIKSKRLFFTQISSISEENILILDTNSSYTDIEAILDQLNSADNVASKYWFRMLNVQPREGAARFVSSESLLFLSSFNITGGNFMANSDSGNIIK